MVIEQFQFYSDYYAFAAEAGLNRARVVFSGIATSRLVNIPTIINRTNADLSIANVTRAFDTSYEHLWQDGQERGSLQDAFFALSQYLLEKVGTDVNTFLTNNNLKVSSLYATLANIFGESITSDKVK